MNHSLAPALLVFTLLFATPQQQRQFLDAGKGQRPFDVTIHAVPIDEVVNGGPARDAIPALDRPKFVSASKADRFLRTDGMCGALRIHYCHSYCVCLEGMPAPGGSELCV